VDVEAGNGDSPEAQERGLSFHWFRSASKRRDLFFKERRTTDARVTSNVVSDSGNSKCLCLGSEEVGTGTVRYVGVRSDCCDRSVLRRGSGIGAGTDRAFPRTVVEPRSWS